jgi:hypothetical protein
MGDMEDYVEQREQLVGNCGPQNEGENVTEAVNVFKLFFFFHFPLGKKENDQMVHQTVSEDAKCHNSKYYDNLQGKFTGYQN